MTDHPSAGEPARATADASVRTADGASGRAAGGRPAARRSPVFTGILTLIAVYLLFLVVPNIGPVVRAARADGSAGVFTARHLECVSHPGHEACSWIGDFRSTDGTIERTGVALYGSDRGTLTVGERTPAVDTGRLSQVYGPGGSNEWVFTFLLVLAGAAILIFLYGKPLRRLVRPLTR